MRQGFNKGYWGLRTGGGVCGGRGEVRFMGEVNIQLELGKLVCQPWMC